MFCTFPPPELLELQVPEDLKAITLRISNIRPSGEINVYSAPHRTLWPHTFDASNPQHRIETSCGTIGIQKMSGAETFDLEIVATETEAPKPEDEGPKPISMMPRQTLLDRLE